MALSVIAMRALLAAQQLKRGGAKLFDLPATGQISAGQINEELGRPYASEFNIGGAAERTLAGVPTGEISFSDFHGKASGTNNLGVGFDGVSKYGFIEATFGSLVPNTIEVDAQTWVIDNLTTIEIAPTQFECDLEIVGLSGFTYPSMTLVYKTNDISYIFTYLIGAIWRLDGGVGSPAEQLHNLFISNNGGNMFFDMFETPP